MNKPKSFFQNLIKPFSSGSNRDQSEVDLEKIAAQEQKQFSFDTLVSATKKFTQKLGQGGFGPVFKGKLDDGREIAVKKLSHSSNQGKKEFQNEAKLLARVQHRNVVNLLGYCVHNEEKLLVYEYLPNESLDKFLFKADKRELLDWKRRHDIIAGVAKGLLYLHEEAHCRIIHRDIKASNILLDEKWVPKIADFGMARLFAEDQTHVNTRVAGTNGYMAPEYLMHGTLSEKADVYSFGVVVLELISGQKNSNFNRDHDFHSLLEWAYDMYKKQRSLEIMDPTLASSADPDQIRVCIQIGLLCVQSDPKIRPDMARVVVILARKPSTLEEPTRPGYPGTRYRKSRPSSAISTGTTGGASSSQYFGSTSSNSQTEPTSGLTSPRLVRRSHRPTASSSSNGATGMTGYHYSSGSISTTQNSKNGKLAVQKH